MSDPNNYTVGWICAISTEFTAAQCFLDERHEPLASVSPRDGNCYALGRMGRHNVAIAVLPSGEYGTNSAAAVARDMLHTFPNVRICLMVGIGGGAPSAKNDIRLGDVVVSSPGDGKGGVIQYDMGKAIQGQGFHETGFLNKPPGFLLTAVSALKSEYKIDGHQIAETIDQILKQKKRLRKEFQRPDPGSDKLYVSTMIHTDQQKTCEAVCGDEECHLIARAERDADDDDPAIFHGLIASANQVMKDANIRDRLAREKNVLCFEMEAAGLMNHFPCLVVRGICDYSDSHKNKAWQGYAAMTAAAYTKDLLKLIPPNKIEAERKISEVLASVKQDFARLEQGVNKIRSNLDKNEDQAILNWISPGDDYGTQQSHHLRRREPETGQWLLDMEAFRTWLAGRRGSLFCRGMPGAGKTILTAVVVDHLIRKCADKDKSAIGVAFLYCSISQKERQKTEDLLLSILKHFSQGLPSLPESVRALHQTHQGARTRPLLAEIVNCLEAVVQTYRQTFVIVDALDECALDCRSPLLKTLFRLRDAHGVNLFATSNHSIEIPFPKSSVVEIKANPNDVQRYLDAHMSELPGFVTGRPGLRDRIKQAIARAACGMFLMVYLYLRSLASKHSPREIETALADMTKTYETLYGDIMQRIERSDHAEFAKKALSLAVFARRPLTTSELLHALAVNPEDTSFDDDNIPNIEVVMSACAGLLTIHEESDVVYLAHQTAQEYLRHGTGNKRFLPDAKAYIASVCISYLSFDDFEAGFCATDADLEARLSKHPFYGYAARNWGHHAREASLLPSDNTTRLGIFCGSPPKTEAAAQAMLAIKEYSPWSGYSQEAPRGVTCLHMAARFGATEMAKDLLRQSGGVAHVRGCDVLDSDRRSPLMWAVALGNLETAQMLLEAGADPNLKDKDGRTPLSIAAENGSTEIIEALLREERLTLVGDSQRDEAGRSPLSWAARSGHVNAVRALLAHSDLEAGEADNPLLWAILSDSDAVVATILEAAVQRAGRGWKERIAPNALCLAAETGQTAKFTHLLSALGCDDVNCRDGDGMTPLMKAVLRGHEDMTAALLLRLGADPSLHDRNGRTAFSLAATFGHDALVTLLLRHARDKIDVEDTDLNGRTPLSLAAEHGHETIVKTLLELEGGSAVDVDRPDTARQTPLFWAARGGHGAVVRHLLDTGRVDVNAVSVYGQTPLSKAVEGFHVATVKILQEHGAVTAASVEEGPLAGLSLRSEDGLLEEDGSDIDYDYHSDEDDD